MLLNWFARWLRATFDVNPTFPLSVLLLLAGLRCLATDGTVTSGGTIDAGSPLVALVGVSIFQAYELLLLGAGLLVLWPRRIAYETTSILRIVGVIRFASPFLLTGLALDWVDTPGQTASAGGHPGAAALLGLFLTGLMVLKGEAIVRKLHLDLRPWERGWDYALFGLAAVGFPLLGNRLAAWTGQALSHADARLLQLGLWWGLAALLAPLALGLTDLGREGPLRSRRPAAWWRVLSLIGYTVLFHNALRVAGTPMSAPFALFPLLLVGVAVIGAVGRAAGFARLFPIEQLPAALGALLLLLDPQDLLGPVPVLSRPVALLLWLPVAGLSLRLLAPDRVRAGLTGLAALVAVAPLRLLPGADPVAAYLLGLAALLLGLGLVRRQELLVTLGALGGAAAGMFLLRAVQHGVLQASLAASALLALGLALRLPRADLPVRIAAGLYALGWGLFQARGQDDPYLWLEVLGAAGALLALGLRARTPALGWASGASLLGPSAWRLLAKLDPGVALVGLAFAAIPAGTWIAVRREDRAGAAGSGPPPGTPRGPEVGEPEDEAAAAPEEASEGASEEPSGELVVAGLELPPDEA